MSEPEFTHIMITTVLKFSMRVHTARRPALETQVEYNGKHGHYGTSCKIETETACDGGKDQRL